MGYKLLRLKDIEIGDIVWPYLEEFHGPYQVCSFTPIDKEQYGHIHEFHLTIRPKDRDGKKRKVDAGHVVIVKRGSNPQRREVYFGIKLHELIEKMSKQTKKTDEIF